MVTLEHPQLTNWEMKALYFEDKSSSYFTDPGGHFAIGPSGGMCSKNFCYDPIQEEIWDFETQVQNMDVDSVNTNL